MKHNDKEATPAPGGSQPKQASRTDKILAYLHSYHAEHGLAPTYREIAQACHIPTTSVVRYHLYELERQGLIKCHRNISRGIVLLAPPEGRGRDH